MSTSSTPGESARAVALRHWSEVTGVPVAAVADSSHFFSDGGNSMLAVELVTATGEELGISVEIDTILLDGTFGSFLQTVEYAMKQSRGNPEVSLACDSAQAESDGPGRSGFR